MLKILNITFLKIYASKAKCALKGRDHQFSLAAQSCLTLCDPMDYSYGRDHKP